MIEAHSARLMLASKNAYNNMSRGGFAGGESVFESKLVNFDVLLRIIDDAQEHVQREVHIGLIGSTSLFRIFFESV